MHNKGMNASDVITQIRNRSLYKGKLATADKPKNKTLQTDSQTLINLKQGPNELTNGKVVWMPACEC